MSKDALRHVVPLPSSVLPYLKTQAHRVTLLRAYFGLTLAWLIARSRAVVALDLIISKNFFDAKDSACLGTVFALWLPPQGLLQ